MTSDLANLTTEAQVIAADALRTFGELTERQINWKPSEDEWSIGQCVNHLMRATAPYFPIFEAIIRGEKKQTLWESMPILPRLFGKMLINVLGPEASFRMTAPKIFQPSAGKIDQKIVAEFLILQDKLINLMSLMGDRDLDRIKVTSPVSRFIAYSLNDCFKILIVHERQHLNQTKRVLAAKEFPRTAG